MKISSVQLLRALAAFAVAFLHCQSEIGELSISPPSTIPELRFGVDVFFVISGFIMGHTTRNENGRSGAPGRFFVRRVIRIAPLYWLFTTLMLLATVFAAKALTNPGLESWHTTASYLFLPALHPTVETYQPLLRVGWTLNFEMFFYALFAISLLAPRLPGIIGTCLVLIGLVCVGQLIVLPGVLQFYTRSIILEFAMGLIISIAYGRGMLRGSLAGIVLLAAAGAGFVLLRSGDSEGLRGIVAGLPAALLVAGALCIAVPSRSLAKAFDLLGASSYAFYLSHLFSIGAEKWLLQRVLGATALDGQVVVAIVAAMTLAAMVAALLFYVCIERPVEKRLKLWGDSLSWGRKAASTS
jgi:peptidoglycan/LPS O-acetylase OafA/YrhL